MSDPALPLKQLKKTGVPRRNRLRRLRVRHYGDQAQRVLHPEYHQLLGLQAVSKYAREAGEFVNLYSKWRGINRWPALLMSSTCSRSGRRSRSAASRCPTWSLCASGLKEETKLSTAAQNPLRR